MSDSRPACTLAMDADLRSLPDGSPQTHWGPAALWALTRAARAVRAYLALLDTNDATYTKVNLVAECSMDGRSWQPLSDDLLGSQSGREAFSSRGVYDNIYLGRREIDFPLLVRYGIRVWNTNATATEGRVRVTAIVEPIDGPVTTSFLVGSADMSLTAGATKLQIGNAFSVSGAKSVSAFIDVTELSGSLTVFLDTHVNNANGDGTWAEAGSTGGTALTTTGARVFEATMLGVEARLSYTTAGGTTGKITCEVVIRDF
jgi:hypothetical protein